MTVNLPHSTSLVPYSPLLDIGQTNVPSTLDAPGEPPLEEIRQRITEVLTADVDLSRAERIHIDAMPIVTWRISVDIYPRI